MNDQIIEQTQSIEWQPSHTAGIIAFCRACASKEKDERFRGPDYLAKVFHMGRAGLLLKLSSITLPLLRKRVPGLFEYIIARTRFFDHVFRQALENNCPQIVLLGAGYDTRTYRFKDYIQETRVFELDVPTTQHVKREALIRAHISIPDQLRFVPINFNKDNIGQVLFEAKFDRNRETLFVWEGVTMYLAAEAVDSTLDFIARGSPPESTVAFDYVYKSVIDGTRDYYGAKEIVKATARSGEFYRFGIAEGEIESFLGDRGFGIIAHHTADDFQRTYLTADDGSPFGRIAAYFCNVHAVVTP